jgi:regulatory protein
MTKLHLNWPNSGRRGVPMADFVCITAIKADAREPNLRKIHSGSKVIGRIRRQDVDALQLAVHDELDPSMLDAIAACDRRVALRLRAIRSLSRAAASRQRLATRLAPHADNFEQVTAILDELEQDGLLDDAVAADQIAQEVLRRGPIGTYKLTSLLRSRGFGGDLSRSVAAKYMSDRDELADALEAAGKAARGLDRLPLDTARRRLTGRLARKGFSAGVVRETVDRTLSSE